MEAIPMVSEALTALLANNDQDASQFFAKDCTFLLPAGPYKIDSYEELRRITSFGIPADGRIQIGQSQQRRVGRNATVAISWASFPKEASGVAVTGFCTAVVAEGKIVHLHLSTHL